MWGLEREKDKEGLGFGVYRGRSRELEREQASWEVSEREIV